MEMDKHAEPQVAARWKTGSCAVCGRAVKVRWDGTVWAHRGGKPDPAFNCYGTGQPPKARVTGVTV